MTDRGIAAESLPTPKAGVRDPRRRRLVSLAVGVVLAGMLAAVLFSGAGARPSDPTSAEAAPGIDTASAELLQLSVDSPSEAWRAPAISLVDQNGRPTTLQQFRGKVVVWSLNDDQCTDLCALFAQDVIAADHDLGRAAKHVVFLSVNANPFYPSPAATRAWSVRNDLEGLPNWVYLSGSPKRLAATWKAYEVEVLLDRKTRTVEHDTVIEFIDPSGKVRAMGEFQAGSFDTAYYGHAMAQMANDLLPAAEQVDVGGPEVDAASTAGATIGERAPGFDLPVLGSPKRDESLEDLSGEPLVLTFWSSTCSLCTQELPGLEQVYSDFKRRVQFVGIDVADPSSSPLAFARRLGVRFTLLSDHAGAIAADYRVVGLPVTFIISPSGQILARHSGRLTAPELVAVLQMELPNLPEVGG